MNDDANNARADNPKRERESTALHLGQLAPSQEAAAPAFRLNCQNEVPRPKDIRCFRPSNRETIQKTLEKALRFAREKVAEAWSPSNPFRGKSPLPATLPAGQKEETQNFARRGTSERIDKATFSDGMSM